MTEPRTNSMTPTAVVAASPGVRVRNFRGRLLVARGGQAVQLEDVGIAIWRLLDGVRTVADIGEAVAAEYDAPVEVVISDAVDLLDDLATSGLVTRLS